MFLFGHLGIGSTLIRPVTRKLSFKAVLCGTILSDLLDKSLYYGTTIITGLKGNEIPLLHGTRSFGHSALFVLILGLFAFFRKSKLLAALTLGAATHLLLDSVGDYFLDSSLSSTLPVSLLWPFLGFDFPTASYQNPIEHLSVLSRRSILVFEGIGIVLLFLNIKTQKKSARFAK